MELDAVVIRCLQGITFGPGSEIGMVLIGRMEARKADGRPSGSFNPGLVVGGLPGMTRRQTKNLQMPAGQGRAAPQPFPCKATRLHSIFKRV